MTKQKDTPKVTIVTVTYNAEKYLEQTIKSVIEQDYKNIEYAIIDGGSSDATIDIIKKYADHIDYWISERDNGIYDAMNKGTLKATGDYINYLNAGDVFTDINTISTVVFNLDKLVDVLYGGVNLWYKDKAKYIYDAPRKPETIFKQLPCCHQSMFIKTTQMKKHLYNTNFKLSSDVELFFELFKNKVNFQVLNQPIVNFLMGGKSQNENFKAHIEVLNIASKYINGTELYRHSSYIELQKNNPYLDEFTNLSFSIMYNKLLQQVKIFSDKYQKIVLYGYGHIGRMIYSHIEDKIILKIDKNYDNKTTFDLHLIDSVAYDAIIIAILGREDIIVNELLSKGISRDKILTFNLNVSERKNI